MRTNKELLKTNAEKYAKNRSVDPNTIDFQSIIDKEMSEAENWKKIREEVEKRMDREDKLEEQAENISTDEIRAKEREIEEKYIEHLDEEREQKMKEKFEGDQHEEVQQYYTMFNYYVKSIARGHHTALMVNAEPGIGKSYQTSQTLINEVGNEKFEKSPAVSSPFEFYKKLWKLEQDEQKDILVLDDIEGLLSKRRALAILKQATWTEGEDRYVGWSSSPSKLKLDDGTEIPSKFKFTGKLIMIFNDVPSDDAIFDSLKDRCFYYELSFTYEQKVELLKSVADKGMGLDVDEEDRKEIARWLIDVTTPATEGLNLRTLEKSLIHFKSCEDIGDVTWKDAIKQSLRTDEKMMEARDIVKDSSFDTVKERKQEFKDRTGMSGKSYERARDELVENSDHIREIVESR